MTFTAATVVVIAAAMLALLYISARPTPRARNQSRLNVHIYTGIHGEIWLVVRIGRRILPTREVWVQLSADGARDLSEQLHLSAYRSHILQGERP